MYRAKHKDALEGFEVKANNIKEARELLLKNLGWEVSYVENEIDYSIYHQRDKRYAGIKLGNSNLSFQNYGCFTFVLAFLVKRDPIEVHELLKKAGAYSGANIISQKAADVLGLELLKGDDKYLPGKMNDINYMPKFTSIKEVWLGKSQHFVVRIVGDNGERSIFDPWEGEFMKINYYPFKSYRLFKLK